MGIEDEHETDESSVGLLSDLPIELISKFFNSMMVGLREKGDYYYLFLIILKLKSFI